MGTTTDLKLLAAARAASATGEGAALRKALGLSLQWMGDEVGVTAASIWRWEQRLQPPTGPRAVRYGRVLARLRRMQGAS